MKKIIKVLISFLLYVNLSPVSIRADSTYQQVYIINQSSSYINYLITYIDSGSGNTGYESITGGENNYFMSGTWDETKTYQNSATMYNGLISNKLDGVKAMGMRNFLNYRPRLNSEFDIYFALADHNEGYFIEPHIHLKAHSDDSKPYYIIVQDDGIYLQTNKRTVNISTIAVDPSQKIAEGIAKVNNNQRLQNVVFNLQKDIPLTLDGFYYLDGEYKELHKNLEPYEAFVLESDVNTRVKWRISPIVTYFYEVDQIFTSNWNYLEMDDIIYGKLKVPKTHQFGYCLMRITYPYYWHISNNGKLTLAPADFNPITPGLDNGDSPMREYRISNTWLHKRIRDDTYVDGLGSLFVPRCFFMAYQDKGINLDYFPSKTLSDVPNANELYKGPRPTHIADDPFRLYADMIKEVEVKDGIHWYSIDNLFSSLKNVEKITLPNDWPNSSTYTIDDVNEFYTPGQFTLGLNGTNSFSGRLPYGSPFYDAENRSIKLVPLSFEHNLPGDTWLNENQIEVENTNLMVQGTYIKKIEPSYFIEIPPTCNINESQFYIYGKGSSLNNLDINIECSKEFYLYCDNYSLRFKSEVNNINNNFNDVNFLPISKINFIKQNKPKVSGEYKGVISITYSIN